MRNNQPKFISYILIFVELIVINLSFWFFADEYGAEYDLMLIHGCLLFNICWLLVEWTQSSYQVHALLKSNRIIAGLIGSCSLHITVSIFALYALNYRISRLFIFKFYLVFAVGVFILRIIFSLFLKSLAKDGYSYKNILIVGTGKEAAALQELIESDWTFGVKISGFVPHNDSDFNDNLNILGQLKDLSEIVNEKEIHEVYWTGSTSVEHNVNDVIKICEKEMVRFHVIPEYLNFPLKNLNVFSYGGMPVMHFRNEPLELTLNRFVKRLFDILFSLLVIVFILSWLLPIIAVLIKLTSSGPVFFLQKRTGRDNRSFNMIKFRTMTVNKDSDEKQATQGDARITPLGSFLRKTSLDELPQFFNSLIGNMSVVGPRPHMLKHTADYSKIIDKFMARHFVKSGITGLAQANGARGETKTIDEMEKRVEYDVWYLENWSLWLDVKICLLTIWCILFNKEKAY
ncbi:MAG: undecaprenyl-phosphate glucose phosphotransferase [Lentisphaeraceae bacterium]|nr:undecaprenyl-phosphate glucose phosphotransferase [Lentisphaeraceae bacterium]